MSRFTRVKKNGSIIPVGAEAENITLKDGSILEEALGDINLAEKGSIMTQIQKIPDTLGQTFASIKNPIFQESARFQNQPNSIYAVQVKPLEDKPLENENSEQNSTPSGRAIVSIKGELEVLDVGSNPARSRLGQIHDSQWEGAFEANGKVIIKGDQSGLEMIGPGLTSTLDIYLKKDDTSNSAKVHYVTNNIHSFNIASENTLKEIATISNSGIKVNGNISCDSFSSPDVAKLLRINSLDSLIDVMTDYTNYPGWVTYNVWLSSGITSKLVRNNGFSAPGLAFKTRDTSKNLYHIYLFFFGTGGSFFQSSFSYTKATNPNNDRYSLTTKKIGGTTMFNPLSGVSKSKINNI